MLDKKQFPSWYEDVEIWYLASPLLSVICVIAYCGNNKALCGCGYQLLLIWQYQYIMSVSILGWFIFCIFIPKATFEVTDNWQEPDKQNKK